MHFILNVFLKYSKIHFYFFTFFISILSFLLLSWKAPFWILLVSTARMSLIFQLRYVLSIFLPFYAPYWFSLCIYVFCGVSRFWRKKLKIFRKWGWILLKIFVINLKFIWFLLNFICVFVIVVVWIFEFYIVIFHCA